MLNVSTVMRSCTRYGLYGPDIEPGRGEIFRIRPNPRVHPSSYTIGVGSFSGVKLPGRGVDHPPHLAPRLRKDKTTSAPPLGLRGLFQGELYSDEVTWTGEE
jgi:hypothetical protein